MQKVSIYSQQQYYICKDSIRFGNIVYLQKDSIMFCKKIWEEYLE